MEPVLAHQGGWDELLFVLSPVAVFGTLLWMANRRAKREAAEAAARAAGHAPAPAPGDADRDG